MFCPEDGTRIEPYTRGKPTLQPYPPCGTCGVRYVHDVGNGSYYVDGDDRRFKHLYAPHCICEPGSPNDQCLVDGYDVFMRHREYYAEGRRDEVPASPGHEGGCHL
ncbi:hypothetical protein LCGC14_2027220 [marine sediment metagenome]|uniref:Uncharacterized protein n=1 Tax=marine sediment metagenome TaxID=412755 RepID=A0A0F9EVS1_9ZZZZ